MAHIIEIIENQTFQSALVLLKAAHAFIAERVIQSQKTLSLDKDCWGMAVKRTIVDLSDGPQIVGKKQEKFVEIINILATFLSTIRIWPAALDFYLQSCLCREIYYVRPQT